MDNTVEITEWIPTPLHAAMEPSDWRGEIAELRVVIIYWAIYNTLLSIIIYSKWRRHKQLGVPTSLKRESNSLPRN